MAVNPRRSPGVPGNFAQSGRLGFGVGDPVWLNSEASKVRSYWRQVEYGNADLVGRYLGGLWSSVPGERGSRIGGEDLVPFGGGGQQFVPFFREMRTPEDAIEGALAALGYLRNERKISFVQYREFRNRLEAEGVEARVPTLGQIKKAIVGQEAYKQAWASFDGPAQETEAIVAIFGQMSYFTSGVGGRGGYKRSVLADRSGRAKATKADTRAFLKRTGFITGSALSQKNQSLGQIDQTFRRELTQVNRRLAEALAQRVAEIQEEATKRPAVQTRALAKATLAPENRFPS